MSQSLTETWQAGLKAFRHFPCDGDSKPCQTLLLKAAAVCHDKLRKVDTLERYSSIDLYGFHLSIIILEECVMELEMLRTILQSQTILVIIFVNKLKAIGSTPIG